MAFFTRFTNGWQVAKSSFKVLSAHKALIVFPILAGASLSLIIASYYTSLHAHVGWVPNDVHVPAGWFWFLLAFGFYIAGYFITTFFNIH